MDKALRDNILSKIKPNLVEQEALEGIVKRFITRLRRSSKRLNYNCSFFVGGSFGKGTYLKGTSDIDIFCRFDLSYLDSNLSDYLKKILDEAKIKYKKQKGSRDYYSCRYVSKGVSVIFELIPNRNVSNVSEILNSTDVSPFHVTFLKSKIQENPQLQDEIRLTKQYFKANGLYGAESYINGFSGHSIDILIIYYGSLKELIKAGRSWVEEVFIDVNNFYANKNEGIKNIGSDKVSNLILIDPIIKERNAAKALGNDKFCEFVLLCNRFSEFKLENFEVFKPDVKLVQVEAKEFAKKNNLKPLIYKFKFEIKDESEDIVGSKLLKLNKKLKNYFEASEFDIFLNDFFIDIKKGYCLMIFLFEKINMPKVKKVVGPKVFMVDAAKSFLKNRSYYFIEDSKICVYETRVVQKLPLASNLDLEYFTKLLGKDISFVKYIRRYL